MRVAIVLLLALALPAPAGADVWQGPVGLGATEYSYPHVAVRSNGEAVALWTLEGRVVAAFRRPSGTWSRARIVARGAGIVDEQLALDRGGTAIAVWVQEPGRVMAAVRRPGGRFGTPVRIGRRSTQPDLPLHLALQDGHAAVTWAQDSYGGVRLVWRRNGVFGRPQLMPSWGSDAAVALTRHGRLRVLLERGKGIWATSRRPGRAFAAPRRLARGGWPAIAAGARGDVVAAWGDWRTHDHAEPPSPGRIWAAIAPPGRRLGAPRRVTPDTPRALAPRLAVGPRGDVLVTWSYAGFDYPAPEIRAWVAARPAGGAFLPAQALSAAGVDATTPPGVAIDGDGIATVVFATRGDVTELQVARGPVGAALPPPAVLATSSGLPGAATVWSSPSVAAADGLTVVLWARTPTDGLDAYSAGE